MRLGDLVQLYGRRPQQAKPPEKASLPLGPGIDCHPRRADIRRIHEDFRHAQPAVLAMVILDRKAADTDRVAGVVALGHRGDPGIEGHRGGEDLEYRAHLVIAERDLVEDPLLGVGRRQLGIGRAGVVGIEIWQ